MIGGLLRGALTAAAFKRGADEAKASLRRTARRAAWGAVAALLLACGAGFLAAAGFMALAEEIGAVEASLAIGLAFAVAGGVVIAATARKRAPAPTSNAAAPLARPLIEVGQEIGAAASRHPATLILAAFVAGLLLSRRGR